jgi:hypothetical protein
VAFRPSLSTSLFDFTAAGREAGGGFFVFGRVISLRSAKLWQTLWRLRC